MISPETLHATVNTLGLISMLVVVSYHFVSVNGKYMVAQDQAEVQKWRSTAAAS